jgi:glycosyltransferase involved in cell wall biosynthesis
LSEKIRGRDMVYLSSQDWDCLRTRKQRFAQRFAEQGNRVLYVEAQASLASLGVYRNDWRRLFRWLRGPRLVATNLHVATLPLVLPFFQMSRAINRINNWPIQRLLRHWLRRLGYRNPVVWAFNPHNEGLIGKLGEKVAIYECVDELSASKGLVRSSVVRALERRLLEKADLVIVTHDNLRRSKEDLAKSIYVIPNGAEVEHFGKAALAETPLAPEMSRYAKPIIGFLGAVQYWIDFDLIRHIALARPTWSLVLVGPVGRLARVDKVRDLPNVHLLGRRPYEDLPSYLKAWDVCINPYILDETAANCSPLKLYEYLATGKPIVSVDMPEARQFEGLVDIARDDEDFVKRIDLILDDPADQDRRARLRIEAVAPHSWDQRFAVLEGVLQNHWGTSSCQ